MTLERGLPTPEHSQNEHDAAHTYPPAPSDEGAKYNSGRTQQEWREILHQDYRDDYEGVIVRRNADGTETPLRAYRFTLGVSEQDYDQRWAEQMIPLTVDAGLELGLRPILIPNAGYRGSDHKPFDDLWLAFEENETLAGLDSTQVGGAWHQKVEAEIAAIQQPLTLQWKEMFGPGVNPREPMAALDTLINDSPYADALKEVSQQDTTAQMDTGTQ